MLIPPYRELGRFAGSLATCLEASVGLDQSLKTSQRALSNTKFASAVEAAVDHIRSGSELSSALATSGTGWPPFFIPLLKAGEQTGRVDESLRYLEHHCSLLDGPARALRNTWLLPLSILVGGSLIQLVLVLIMRSLGHAFWFAVATMQDYVVLACFAVPFFAPPLKPLLDPIKLVIPFWNTIERELAVNRFFRVMSLLYATGGQRVEAMIHLASLTVPNVTVRRDLLKANAEVEHGSTMGEAFATVSRLTPAEKEMIAIGDLSGTLERSFDRIADSAGEILQRRLESFQRLSVRLTYLIVCASLALVVLRGVGSIQR